MLSRQFVRRKTALNERLGLNRVNRSLFALKVLKANLQVKKLHVICHIFVEYKMSL